MAQPSAADIDRFRLAFFQQVVEQEEKKVREKARQQRSCYHRYEPTTLLPNGYMEFFCSKCDHMIQRLCVAKPH